MFQRAAARGEHNKKSSTSKAAERSTFITALPQVVRRYLAQTRGGRAHQGLRGPPHRWAPQTVPPSFRASVCTCRVSATWHVFCCGDRRGSVEECKGLLGRVATTARVCLLFGRRRPGQGLQGLALKCLRVTGLQARAGGCWWCSCWTAGIVRSIYQHTWDIHGLRFPGAPHAGQSVQVPPGTPLPQPPRSGLYGYNLC